MPPKTQTQLLKHVSGAATRYSNCSKQLLNSSMWTCFLMGLICFFDLFTRTRLRETAACRWWKKQRSHMKVWGRIGWWRAFCNPLFLHCSAALCAVIHAWVNGPDAGLIPPREAGIPRLRASPSTCIPTAALRINRLPWGFIGKELNTVRHAMLTLLSPHCVITQLASAVCKT